MITSTSNNEAMAVYLDSNNGAKEEDGEEEEGKEYLIFELPPEIASDWLSPSAQFWFKKSIPSDHVVLCTENSTFALKFAETSNILLLGSLNEKACQERKDVHMMSPAFKHSHQVIKAPLTTCLDVRDSGHHFVEVNRMSPSFDGIYSRLIIYHGVNGISNNASVHRAHEDSSIETIDKITQASRVELLNYFNSIDAFEFEGHWRIMDVDESTRILKLIIANLVENELDENEISFSAIAKSLVNESVPDAILTHILKTHSNSCSLDGKYSLSKERINRTLGLNLLTKLEPSQLNLLSDFMESWKSESSSLDWTVDCSLSQLRGLCLVDEGSLNPTIKFQPKYLFSIDPKKRFEELFKIRIKWKRSEILQYIDDLAPSILKLDPLILKYSRVSKVGGTVYLSSRI